jgi:hypothetical protein
MPPSDTVRRRRTPTRPAARTAPAAVLVTMLALGVAGCVPGNEEPPVPSTPPAAATSPASGPAPPPTTPAPTSTPPELPRGGRSVFPEYRLVGFAGHPGSRALGRLGVGSLDARAREIVDVAHDYAGGRSVLPVLELIATIVRPDPGGDGRYRTRTIDTVIAEHLAAARKVKGILLLDIQPGRADFLDEVRAYARWLAQPDVGIALDPEWAMGPGQVPMRAFGHTTGKEIDQVAAYLAGIVKRHDLPEKVLVFHQLAPSIVRSEGDLRPHPGVAVVKSIDGIGSRAMKEATYRKLVATMPRWVHAGFKLFYDEDRRSGPLMTPKQVLALTPQPEYVLYE